MKRLRQIISRYAGACSTVPLVLFMGIVPSQAAFKQIRDVYVLCNFAQDCSLVMSVPQNAVIREFSIARKAESGAQPEFLLGISGEALPHDALPNAKISVAVDGKRIFDVPLASFAADKTSGNFRFDGTDVTKLIAAMKAGKAAEVTFDNGGKRSTAKLSLSGFVAGLLYLDEQQARDGTVDALQAKGAKPAPASPPVRLINDLADIPQAIRAEFSGEDARCSLDDTASLRIGGGFSASIADDLGLIALPCGASGAYNQLYVVYSEQDGKLAPLVLPVMSDAGPSTTNSAWNIDWSQSTKTLTGFYKGRGLGDCGSYNVWTAESDEEGLRFVLKQARSKGDCDGDYAGGPQNWPASWPVKQ